VAAIWRIVWGAVPGYTAPLPETETLDPGEILTFFGHYTLEEGFRVNKVSKTVAGDPEKIRIEWYSEVGKWYQVQGTNELVTGSWQNIGSPLPGSGALMSYEEPIGESEKRFLRVQAL
jgi:hypothetical protein